MGLFKDIYCAKCGKKTRLLTRTRLADDNYLCSDCTSMIPDYMLDSVRKSYSYQSYNSLLEYIDFSHKVLRPIFQTTHSYYNIHIDVDHGLFYIGRSLNDSTVLLRMRYIDDYALTFTAEELKEGTFGDKVTGRILFRLQMGHPVFYYETILDNYTSVKAKKAFFGTEYRYENPKGMDDFLLLFEAAMVEDLKSYKESLEDEVYGDAELEETTELQQAMSLFMIDDLSAVTLADLKAQRNRLIKTFHPDATSDGDTKYAQKINQAYEVLKQYTAE